MNELNGWICSALTIYSRASSSCHTNKFELTSTPPSRTTSAVVAIGCRGAKKPSTPAPLVYVWLDGSSSVKTDTGRQFTSPLPSALPLPIVAAVVVEEQPVPTLLLEPERRLPRPLDLPAEGRGNVAAFVCSAFSSGQDSTSYTNIGRTTWWPEQTRHRPI